MFKVSKEAEKDLRDIGRHTQREWGIEQRRKYLNGLDRQFHLLAGNPLANPERREFSPPMRIHHYLRHLIIYQIEGPDILILRVLHQAMDVPSQLADDDDA